MKVTIRRGRNHDQIKQARVEHLFGIGKAGEICSEFAGSSQALGLGITNGNEAQPRGVLYRQIVLVADGTVCQEANANRCGPRHRFYLITRSITIIRRATTFCAKTKNS